MMSRAWSGIGLLLLLAGCAATPQTETADPDKVLADLRDLVRAANECVGRFYRDSEHTVIGKSECRNRADVFFRGRTDATLAEGLSCDYTQNYAGADGGTGRISCSDGNTGDFVFEGIDSTHGIATARMENGREIEFTFTQAVR